MKTCISSLFNLVVIVVVVIVVVDVVVGGGGGGGGGGGSSIRCLWWWWLYDGYCKAALVRYMFKHCRFTRAFGSLFGIYMYLVLFTSSSVTS